MKKGLKNTNELFRNIYSAINQKHPVSTSRVKDYITTITLLDTISDPIFILNAEGIIEYINRNAYKLFSTSFDSLVGKSFKDLIVSDSIETENPDVLSKETFFDDLLASSLLDITIEMMFNKIRIPVLINSNPVYAPTGELEFIVVTTVDLSRRESHLKECQQNHAESIYYNRMRTIGELGVSVIHELSQPLLSLNLLLDMLKNQIGPDSKQGSAVLYIEQMQALVNKISKTVEYIRSFANKSESAGFELINLQSTIENLRQYIFYDLQENNIDFDIQLDDDNLLVYANPLMLEQAIVNLLKNSIESLRENHPNKTDIPGISVRVKSVRNVWIEIIVDDNGPGILPEIEKKIFTPFFSTKSDPTNTGVGLTISKGIITSFGGDITLQQKDTRGACFKISLPLAATNEATQLYNLIEIQNKY
ncbi:MAG: hypothetical protein DRP96_01085 [Candidatus Neomarinimicrobiota bacterium]|nr:MAG: hypothetical protein DRP96_01085 [Candidatus Neomarinimicrobiota bacterium]